MQYVWATNTPWANVGDIIEPHGIITCEDKIFVGTALEPIEKILELGWIKILEHEEPKLTEEEILEAITSSQHKLKYLDIEKLAKFLAEHLK